MQNSKAVSGDHNTKEPLKTRHKFSVIFLGSMSVNHLYTQAVQPWVMAEVHRKRENVQDVFIEVVGENLVVSNSTGQGERLLWEQHLKGVTRFAKLHQDPKCFAYLTRYQPTADYQCHVYLASSEDMIPQLFKAIREASKDFCNKPGSAEISGLGSRSGVTDGGDLDRCKSLFEVKYLGRVKVGARRVTSDYIDNLAERLIAKSAEEVDEMGQERRKQTEQAQEVWRRRHHSETSIKSLPETFDDVTEDLTTENKLEMQKKNMERPGLRSDHLVPGDIDSCLGSDIFSGSKPLQEVDDSLEHRGQFVSQSMDLHSDSESSRDSLNSSLEQKFNHSLVIPSQQLKSMRSPETGDTSRRRHSSQTEDRSWSGAKVSFRDTALDRQHLSSSESLESIGSIHKHHGVNRIMVLQIGQQDISLISLDKKVSILECKFKDISFLSQGSHKPDLFGIVARDSSSKFYCYILRCLSESLVSEILNTLQVAFKTACNKRGGDNAPTCAAATAISDVNTTQNQVCTSCPLHQFHRICQEIHSLSSQAVYELLVKKVHLLPDKEFDELNKLMQAEAPESFEESSEVMMIYLRQVCERKQRDHVHISETNKSSKSDMMHVEEKHSLLEGLKCKAKKSFTTSFEHLLSRGKKKDDTSDTFRQRSWTTDSETSWTSRDSSTTSTPDVSPMPSPMRKEFHSDYPSPPSSPSHHQKRSTTMENLGTFSHSDLQLTRRRDVNHNTTASPKRTMFLLSTSSLQQSDSLSSSAAGSPLEDTTLLTTSRRPSTSSWRKAIFNKVCTPQHSIEFGDDSTHLDWKLHSTAEVRAMWRKLILESLLLIRMEKENHSIRARQEEGGITLSHKLEYQELTPCLKEITCIWEKMLTLHDDEVEVGKSWMEKGGKTVPKTKLLDYVKKGVPRTLRGQIWLFLMQQQQMCSGVPDSALENANYEDLLGQLTTHQHAILIDLGRTFPNHPYFCKSLGAGQLELFNLLKAYSLLDTEVGYCQGLSFIVGVILMHMEEISAFHVFKYLMYDLGLRKQFRPNMMALQLKLYQLTRLLHDRYKNVYEHFEAHEISPTLYAAPWFLTMFASQFPLGFVARVFDMIFIQGIDALFKVALTLIGSHHALILQCDSFESIVDFLKVTLPEMVQVQMERIINQAFELDIDKELHAYEVEYHVLSEEMTFSSPQQRQHNNHRDINMSSIVGIISDRLPRLAETRKSSVDPDVLLRLDSQNISLKNQNLELLEKLEQAQSHRQSCELSVLAQQIEIDKLKSHIRSLELERAALLSAVATFQKLIPPETLQHIHLFFPDTTSSPFDLSHASNEHNVSGHAGEGEDLVLTTDAKLPPDDQVTCFHNPTSISDNATTTSLLVAGSVRLISPHNKNTDQTSRTLNFDTNEVKEFASSLTSACQNLNAIIYEQHNSTSLPVTYTTPSNTVTTPLSLISPSDTNRRRLHSPRVVIRSSELKSLSEASSSQTSSSSYATQTSTSRSISNTTNKLLAADTITPRRDRKQSKLWCSSLRP